MFDVKLISKKLSKNGNFRINGVQSGIRTIHLFAENRVVFLEKSNFIVFMHLTSGIWLFCLGLVAATHISAEPTTYQYLDGNGNRFLITGESKKTIQYIPVTAEQSSSGTYSGGDPVTKIINEREYSVLVDYFHRALDRKKIRIQNRIKGSGFVSVEGKQKQAYVLDGSSVEKKELESYLFFLIGRIQ